MRFWVLAQWYTWERDPGRPLGSGDVVQLKSGGPPMVLSHAANKDDADDTPDAWWCRWFDRVEPGSYNTAEHKTGIFSLTCLRRVDPALISPTAPSSTSSTTEPDEWQEATCRSGERPTTSPAPGTEAAGPWKPVAVSACSPDGFTDKWVMWRRPLARR